MQTLENDKNPLGVLWCDPEAIVAHREYPGTMVARCPDMDGWRRRAAEFDGIAEEVLEHLQQLRRVSADSV